MVLILKILNLRHNVHQLSMSISHIPISGTLLSDGVFRIILFNHHDHILSSSWSSSPWAPSYQTQCWRQWSPRQSGFSSLLEQYSVRLQLLSLSIEENVLINYQIIQIHSTNQEVLGNRRSHLESLSSHPDTKSLFTLSSAMHFWQFWVCCIATTRPVQVDLQFLTSQVG